MISSTPQHQAQVTECVQASTQAPPNAVILEEDQRTFFDINSSDHAMSQASSPDLCEVLSPPNHRSVELDDVLMLDRTEMLLKHCTFSRAERSLSFELANM